MTNIKDNRLIDGIVVKKRIIAEVKQYAEQFTKMPSLVSILIGDVPEAAVYVRNQARGAEQAGMPFKQINWPSDITQDECKARILALNDDATVLGIILQRPVPDHINVRSLQSAIHPLKDVEGMNPASIGNIVYSDVALAPCTAAASVALIKETGLKLEGRSCYDRAFRNCWKANSNDAYGRRMHCNSLSPYDTLSRYAFKAS